MLIEQLVNFVLLSCIDDAEQKILSINVIFCGFLEPTKAGELLGELAVRRGFTNKRLGEVNVQTCVIGLKCNLAVFWLAFDGSVFVFNRPSLDHLVCREAFDVSELLEDLRAICFSLRNKSLI